MSSKRKSSNGALSAPVPTVLDGIEIPGEEGSKVAKKSNGKTKKSTDSEGYDPELNTKELLRILSEVKNGNFAVRMPIDGMGIGGKICDTLNEIITLNEILV